MIKKCQLKASQVVSNVKTVLSSVMSFSLVKISQMIEIQHKRILPSSCRQHQLDY